MPFTRLKNNSTIIPANEAGNASGLPIHMNQDQVAEPIEARELLKRLLDIVQQCGPAKTADEVVFEVIMEVDRWDLSDKT